MEESFAVLEDLLNNFSKLDSEGYFAEPVQPDMAPNYFEVIERPMDFRTMQEKVGLGIFR